ncbi:MAG: biopolymer transporter ExbD [Gammaproteobacteria bacterium]
MKESRRAKRMSRHHSRRADRTAALNMVSLMDIFTILVFFLLVNATSSEVLPTPKAINLPQSIAEKPPRENLVIMVNRDDIHIQGEFIAKVSSVLSDDSNYIKALAEALEKHKQQKQAQSRPGSKPINEQGVTIMGDKEIPYVLLKKIMLSCASADFANISLAVAHKSDARAAP